MHTPDHPDNDVHFTMSYLTEFPDELLDRILSLSLSSSVLPLSPSRHCSRLAPLLVSQRFSRIGTPHLYHTIHLVSASTTDLLIPTLQSTPALRAYVRELTLDTVSSEAGVVLGLCPGVERLEVMLDWMHGEGDDTVFVRALQELHEMRHLTLRKPGTVYLSLLRVRFVIAGLAAAVEGWPALETADIAFKLSDDTPTSPVAVAIPTFASFPTPQRSQTLSSSGQVEATTSNLPPLPQTPITALTTALSRAPNLHTFTTHLPSVWNVAILTVSTNPRLERIVLVDGHKGSVQFDADYHFESPSPASLVQNPVHTPSNSALQMPQHNCPLQALSSPRETRLSINANTTYTPGRCGPGSILCHTFNATPCTSNPNTHHPTHPSYSNTNGHSHTGGIIGTGLFLMEASNHARLSDLIHKGTVVVRGRAFMEGIPGK
jgi:hypothetical protein